MSKIELGVVVTIILAILTGVLFLGEMNGRLKALEGDKDFASIQDLKNAAMSEIKTERESLNKAYSEFLSKLSGSILLTAKDKPCPEGSVTLNNLAIGVAREPQSGLSETQKITRETDWDLSQNYDGRLFKACLIK